MESDLVFKDLRGVALLREGKYFAMASHGEKIVGGEFGSGVYAADNGQYVSVGNVWVMGDDGTSKIFAQVRSTGTYNAAGDFLSVKVIAPNEPEKVYKFSLQRMSSINDDFYPH